LGPSVVELSIDYSRTTIELTQHSYLGYFGLFLLIKMF